MMTKKRIQTLQSSNALIQEAREKMTIGDQRVLDNIGREVRLHVEKLGTGLDRAFNLEYGNYYRPLKEAKKEDKKNDETEDVLISKSSFWQDFTDFCELKALIAYIEKKQFDFLDFLKIYTKEHYKEPFVEDDSVAI